MSKNNVPLASSVSAKTRGRDQATCIRSSSGISGDSGLTRSSRDRVDDQIQCFELNLRLQEYAFKDLGSPDISRLIEGHAGNAFPPTISNANGNVYLSSWGMTRAAFSSEYNRRAWDQCKYRFVRKQ